MKANRSFYALAGAASVAFLTLGASSSAHADNIYWSVGLSSPGVQVAVTSPQPVYVQQPVYGQQQPVYVQPQVVYQQSYPEYVQPRPYYHVQSAPVYVAPRVVYTGWHHPRYGWRHDGRHEARNEGRSEVRSEVRRDVRNESHSSGPVHGQVGVRSSSTVPPRVHQHLSDPGNVYTMR